MKQTTFASLAFEAKKKLTRRERFLKEMDQVRPSSDKQAASVFRHIGRYSHLLGNTEKDNNTRDVALFAQGHGQFDELPNHWPVFPCRGSMRTVHATARTRRSDIAGCRLPST